MPLGSKSRLQVTRRTGKSRIVNHLLAVGCCAGRNEIRGSLHTKIKSVSERTHVSLMG
ncbi:unnamed protein product [Amoebophrya sp. A120]|nr:unnamed protein product [Amoebophrya sp. A120]|eukprot:GSA120T00016002001.1